MFDPDETTEEAATSPTEAEPTTDEDELGLELEVPDDVVAVILESESLEEEPEAPSREEPVAGPAAVERPFDLRVAVDRLGERLEQRLTGLQAQFDREVRAEAGRERVVDRLHAELQEYKQDLLLKVQRPIFVDLIQLHDDVGKMAEAQGEGSEAVRGMLESIQTAVEDILYRQGVEPFRNEGESFDPRRQRAVTTTPTGDPELARTVSQRLRPGFQAGDKVVRPEIVTVYTLKP